MPDDVLIVTPRRSGSSLGNAYTWNSNVFWYNMWTSLFDTSEPRTAPQKRRVHGVSARTHISCLTGGLEMGDQVR